MKHNVYSLQLFCSIFDLALLPTQCIFWETPELTMDGVREWIWLSLECCLYVPDHSRVPRKINSPQATQLTFHFSIIFLGWFARLRLSINCLFCRFLRRQDAEASSFTAFFPSVKQLLRVGACRPQRSCDLTSNRKQHGKCDTFVQRVSDVKHQIICTSQFFPTRSRTSLVLIAQFLNLNLEFGGAAVCLFSRALLLARSDSLCDVVCPSVGLSMAGPLPHP